MRKGIRGSFDPPTIGHNSSSVERCPSPIPIQQQSAAAATNAMTIAAHSASVASDSMPDISGGEVICPKGSETLEGSRPIPIPAENNMTNQGIRENSGRSLSHSHRMRPPRESADHPEGAVFFDGGKKTLVIYVVISFHLVDRRHRGRLRTSGALSGSAGTGTHASRRA